ncbi:MFS transporter [Segetibacter aerophilus]|uniref:MFS transporter n=1 Tax=Segetibacter aerophilus TaxID=670293 RepID=A0A512BAC2_9BACT|nr:MFS transporter [Segetibacter aerophilus]GEO08914.1 MFS transporter [Segetibacter aerophilus]
MEHVKVGIRNNLQQFTLLVIITAFIGGMVGMERSLIPQLAEKIFHLASKTAMFSFIVAFGATKAITNYYTGFFANNYGRKNLLVTGWLFALPIPWILMYAPTWNWIIAANILLGLNQGLAWSSTVVMKIDLAEEKNRGLAMGLNEFAGYFAVGLITFLVAYLAAEYGLRPYPFFVGVVFSIAGLLCSIFFIKDTRSQMTLAASATDTSGELKNVFWGTTLLNKNLSAVTQAGLVNNMNDGMMWGLYPLLLHAKGFSVAQVGLVTAIYPACWGIGQLFSGRLGDFVPKKRFLFIGMFLQGLTLLVLSTASALQFFIVLSVVLGLGKATVYPIFAAAIAENSHPQQRAQSIGIFRFWRDLGYALGAVLTGVLADQFSLQVAIIIVGCITLLSAFIIKIRMQLLKA